MASLPENASLTASVNAKKNNSFIINLSAFTCRNNNWYYLVIIGIFWLLLVSLVICFVIIINKNNNLCSFQGGLPLAKNLPLIKVNILVSLKAYFCWCRSSLGADPAQLNRIPTLFVIKYFIMFIVELLTLEPPTAATRLRCNY